MPEEQYAVFSSKVKKLVTMDMIKEHWYPEVTPLNENGEVDFVQFKELWEKEAALRVHNYIMEAINSDDRDAFGPGTPNIDALLAKREQESVDDPEIHQNR